ncbi:MAG TPA: O-antigen ligase domain-containing protein, partial [Candidatus Moranbacteria bacterium]|nr:O-antigen ligase domain-containing protein [Candidatus Moranbacteria bacterium]
ERKKIKLAQILVFSGSLVASLGIFQFLLQFTLGVSKTFNLWANYVIMPFLGNTFGKVVIANPSWLVKISSLTYLRAIAIFPDPHMLALFLGMLFPLAVALALKERKKRWIIASCVIFLADLLTFSRGGYLGLLAGFIFLLFIFRKIIVSRYKMVLFLTSVAIFLILITPNPLASRFFSSFNLKEGSNEGRITMWEKAVETIKNYPLLGVGIGNFPLEVNSLVNYRVPIYAHNTYLDIASESGILASFAWIGILVSAWGAFLKRAKKNVIYLGAALSLIIFATHSLVETGIYSPVVLTLLLLILSLNNFKKQC